MHSAASDFSPTVPILPKNEAHVWCCNLDAPSFADPEKILSPDETARAASFHFPLHRARYIAGRATLRVLLSSYLGQTPEHFQFYYNAHGRPELENSAFRFNVSHSENRALFAFCLENDIGVDIEKCRNDFNDERIARLSNRFFCEDESRELNALQSEAKRAAFFRCWTRKEALLKATGEGISGGLKKYQVSLLPDAKPGVLTPREEASVWSVFDLAAPEGFAAALAVRADDVLVREIELPIDDVIL